MVYTRRSVWPLVIGIIMVAYAYLVQSGNMAGLIKFLNTGRYVGEMVTLGYAFGAVAILVGLWRPIVRPLGCFRFGGQRVRFRIGIRLCKQIQKRRFALLRRTRRLQIC